MKQDVKFRRSVYVILLVILLLAILIQIARSDFVLRFNHNEQWAVEREKLYAQQAEKTAVAQPELQACLAYVGQDADSVTLRDNTAKTLEYMKQPTRFVDLDQNSLAYEGCSHVLLATGHLGAVGDLNRLAEYVHEGGAVFFLQTLDMDTHLNQIYRKLGIISLEYANLTQGIHLTSNVLIGEKGMRTGEGFIYNTSISVDIDSESVLLAESLEGVPLLWQREYGKGLFTVFNGDMLGFKASRGMIAGAFSLMKPDYIYPIFNAKLFYIDDFPAPISKEIDPGIYHDYRLDIPSFFHSVWWPDMLKASIKYNVKYTAAVIQSYNDEVKPPFRDPVDEERHNLIAYGREVIKSGGEISLHGYNHQSLQSNKRIADFFGYKTWHSQSDMEESIREAIRYVGTAFPKYKVMSYVPPSNVLGSDGRDALVASWPELLVIASLYDTDYEGRGYIQEFEVAKDGVIELPRVTSGYFEVPYMRWLEANTMTSVGVFSHFIHPDDLLDPKRNNNQNWEQLYQDFTDMLSRLNRTYPWLRDMTSTEAGLSVAGTVQAQVTLTHTSDSIKGEVANYRNELYYVLRTNRKITKQEHCSVEKIDDQTYLVTIHDAKFTVGLSG